MIRSNLTNRKRTGQCIKCGSCCRVLDWKEDLESDGTLQAMQMFGADIKKILQAVERHNVCSDLIVDDSNKTSQCAIYDKRPQHCIDFPRNEWEIDRHQCKGFKFE